MFKRLRIAVIGAGIVGASVAFHLAKSGSKVDVLEASTPGSGASRVSYAWINARDKTPYHYHEFNRRSQDMWRQFEEELDQDIGLVWGGEMRWAATDSGATDFRYRVKELQSWGYPIREISSEEANEMEPKVRFGDIKSASFTTSDGHVDPVRVIKACLEKVTNLGGNIYTNCLIKGVVVSGNRATHIETNKGIFEYDSIIIAAGSHTPKILRMMGTKLQNSYSPGATLITSKLNESLFSTVAAMHTPRDSEGVLLNMRQLTDGRVMIHGGTNKHSISDESITSAEVLIQETARYIPIINDVSVDEVRSALRPMPPDGLPVIGRLESVTNVYVSYTHSGVTLAPIIGAMASLEIRTGSEVEILKAYSPSRFSGQ